MLKSGQDNASGSIAEYDNFDLLFSRAAPNDGLQSGTVACRQNRDVGAGHCLLSWPNWMSRPGTTSTWRGRRQPAT